MNNKIVGLMLLGGGISLAAVTMQKNPKRARQMKKATASMTHNAMGMVHRAGDSMIHMGRTLNKISR